MALRATTIANMTRAEPKNADEHYDLLPEYARSREAETRVMLQPYIEATDNFGKLISRLIYLLGAAPPANVQDSVVRDLTADIFDFLYEARPLILSGKLHVAYPLLRRAFESLCLLHACLLDKEDAEKWQGGKKYENRDLRHLLGKHPMGEPEPNLREMYTFFSRATHPNRDMIAARMLGEGNKWVLGAIGMPELVVMVDHCMKSLELWFWLSASVTHFYKDRLIKDHRDYMHLYYQSVDFEKEVYAWLVKHFNKLLSDAQTQARKG